MRAHVERRPQRIADPVDLLEEVPITQPPIDALDRDPGFTALLNVTVDEVSGSVEHQASRHYPFAGPISFVASLSNNTELATAIQNVQSCGLNQTVPNAR